MSGDSGTEAKRGRIEGEDGRSAVEKVAADVRAADARVFAANAKYNPTTLWCRISRGSYGLANH